MYWGMEIVLHWYIVFHRISSQVDTLPTLDWTFSLKHVGVHNLHRSMENAQAYTGTAQCVGQGDTVDSQLLDLTAHCTLQPIITALEWQILAFHCCQKSSETPSAPYVPLCD